MKRILKMLRGNRRSRQRPQGLGTPMFERLEPRLLLNAVPYMQDFSLGKPGGAEGWDYYSNNEGRIEVVGGRLRMDDTLGNETYSLNESILHVNLTGKTNVTLTLDHWSLADETNTLPSSFVGRYKGDGISLSVDGQNWVKITDLSVNFTNKSFALDTILQQAKVAAGSTDLSDVRIKFQQYDNYSAATDGREFDNIQITAGSVVAQPTPYTQDFSLGKPTGSQGWEYYSDNEGRIAVVGGRLRMDDTLGNETYSLNESILHVNLTGKTGVTLTLDHWSLADETNTLPSSFVGRYKGDGISLSVDGQNWVKVTDLTVNFTNKSFALDTILQQAKVAAGSTDLSDVRIKFQQYDNYSAATDGREFDNIKIQIISAVPEMEVFGNGQEISDGDTTSSAIDHTDFGSVAVGGSLTRTFTIRNTGAAALNLTGVPRVQWTGSTDFTVVQQPGSPVAAYGGTTTFQIQFTPSGTGLKTATVWISNNDSDENPYEFLIQGTGLSLSPVAQAVPYVQDFSLGKPTGSQGWEYYSDNEGRIAVVGGRLRMDDTLGNETYSLNESILHVNLTGKTGVTLTLDHWSLADETNTLPSSFVGRYKGDGISLSVDGQNWVKVTDLTVNFTNKSFALDTILQQAKVAAGSTDLSDVRIKFQQYDNYSAATDGREFDNIKIQIISAVPEMDVFGNGQEISDGDTTSSVVDHTDFGSVAVGGSLTRTFTIRNTGAAALNLTGVPRVQWTGSTDFTVVQQPGSPVSAYGGTTTFQIRFTPSGTGLKTATVWISNNDSDENPYNFVLQGTGSSLSPVAQAVPYVQDFSLGKPTGSQGWEYYSDNEGRIAVVGGRLRMDDTLGNETYSLNESILHVNLTGKTGVTLTLDHWSLADETNTLPSSFVGRYKGDGISLSVDGQNWVKVTDLTVNFTNKSFALDTILQQAKVAAGSTDLSDVRIKFQQYDNYSAATDGREFDNIKIQIISAVPEMEVLGNSPIIADGDTTPSVVDHTDFGSVAVGGSLTRTFTIRNTGSAALNLTGVPRVQWTGNTDFTVVQQPGSPVAAYGGTTTFQIQFAPSGPGLKTATIQIANDDGDENPYDFVIQGTGLSLSPVAQPTPYTQDFSLGKPTGSQGWEYYSDNEGRITVVGGRLRMDDTLGNETYSLNESILHVDLTGKTGVTLTLDHWSLADETNTLPSSFVGRYKGDGISLSVDGQNWVKVTDLTVNFTNKSFALDTILQQAKVAAGSTDLSDVRIKFQQYDNYSAATDGREFDNIQITAGSVVAQPTPYTQDFSLGKPTGSQGWEYYSDNEGRIAVVGGRLRMDDTLGNETYSLNEAILHVNLTGKTGVTLTLDHWSLADETNTLPSSFVGRYKGDGISLSVDGQNWVKVTDLTVNFTNKTFALDTILQQAKVAAGSTDLSDVRIKFQQYDNYSAATDGREFDNIKIKFM